MDESIAVPYAVQLAAWREEMEHRLTAEDGWLTVVGLEWLETGRNTVGSGADCMVKLPASAPAMLGVIDVDGDNLTLHLDDVEGVRADGQPVLDRCLPLRSDAHEGGVVQISIGTVTFFVIQRGGSYAVRVKDTASHKRLAFPGRDWFLTDPSYRLPALFVPHASPCTVEVDTVIGTTSRYNSPGEVAFSWQGAEYRLLAFEGGEGYVWVIFRDDTCGSESYATGRFLYAPVTADGVIDLDFNKAYNPPCAFTAYATCPLPPAGNRLPFAVRAGEKKPVM